MHARFVLSVIEQHKKSWFFQVDQLCKTYLLPSCLSLLNFPPEKITFKKYLKMKIVDKWQQTLRKEAEALLGISDPNSIAF